MLNYYKKKKYGDEVYYSQPWEYDADIRGGVSQNFHTQNDTINAHNYVMKPYNPKEWGDIYVHYINYLKSEVTWLYELVF